jgi:hypothetical protein
LEELWCKAPVSSLQAEEFSRRVNGRRGVGDAGLRPRTAALGMQGHGSDGGVGDAAASEWAGGAAALALAGGATAFEARPGEGRLRLGFGELSG